MRVFNDRTMNGIVNPYRRSIDRQLRKAEGMVASHPGAELLLATLFGILVGIWIKRK
jgi:hypothetical protein